MKTQNIDAIEKRFNDLVMEWNKSINLVSRRKTNIYDLIEDSKLFLGHIDFCEGLRILDLGTGGGIPGVMIKIHHPEIQLTLVDSIQKKIKAVTDIVKNLGMENVEVLCSRAEELAKSKYYKNKFDYIVARSVAALDDLVKWSKDLVKPGGMLITVKGMDITEELLRTRRFKCVKKIEFNINGVRKIVTVKFN